MAMWHMTEDRQAPPRALIRVRRRAAGMTQAELGETVGIGKRQVIRWELGESFPSSDAAVRLAAVLGGEPGDYVKQEGDTPGVDRETEMRRLRKRNSALERRLEDVESAMADLVRRLQDEGSAG